MKLKWTSKVFRVDLDRYSEKKSNLNIQAEFHAKEDSEINDIFIDENDLSQLSQLEHKTTFDLYSGLRAKIRGIDIGGARYGSVVSVSDKTSWTLAMISRHAKHFRKERKSISEIIDVLLKSATSENYTKSPEGRLNYIHLGLKPKKPNPYDKEYVADDIRGLNKVFISNTTTEWTESDEKHEDVIEIFIPELTYHPVEIFRILYLSLFMPELIQKNEFLLLSEIFESIDSDHPDSEKEKHIYERAYDLTTDDFYKVHDDCKNYVDEYKKEVKNEFKKEEEERNQKNKDVKNLRTKTIQRRKPHYRRMMQGFASPSHRAHAMSLHRNKLMIGSISKADLKMTFKRFILLKEFSSKSGNLIFD